MPAIPSVTNTSNPSISVVNDNTKKNSASIAPQGKYNQRTATAVSMTRNFMFLSSEEQATYNAAKAVKNMLSYLITPTKPEKTSACASSDIISKAKYLASISTFRAIQDGDCSSLEDRALNNALQQATSNDDFIELRQQEANELIQGNYKSTALRFIKPDSNLNKLTGQELNEFIDQNFNKVNFAIAVLFQCGDTICPKAFEYIDKYQDEFTPENLNLFFKAISILHMYDYCDSINENHRLNNAQKVKSRLLEFMTSFCVEYNHLLNQSSNDMSLEISQTDSNFLKMGVFAFCCELANLPIRDNADGQIKYKIYVEVMKDLKQTGESLPHMQSILEQIDSLISENRSVFSGSATTPDLSDLYKDIMDLNLKTNTD
jgi:hypothetical protein